MNAGQKMTMGPSQEMQLKALRQISMAILGMIREIGPSGAPGGTIYAALMTHGCTFEQYEQIMSGLVGAGLVRKSGDLYHAN